MLFIATCLDKPKRVETRLANRQAHLAYLAKLGSRVKVAGPFLDETDLATPVGSMLILEGESVADIEALLADDPYAKAGLFESVTVRPWLAAVGQKIG